MNRMRSPCNLKEASSGEEENEHLVALLSVLSPSCPSEKGNLTNYQGLQHQFEQNILLNNPSSSTTTTTTTTPTRSQDETNHHVRDTRETKFQLTCRNPQSSLSTMNGLDLFPSVSPIQVKSLNFSMLLLYTLAVLLIMPACFSNDGSFSVLEAIKLQPDGNKYLWSGDSMVVSCRNNNNVKNAKTRWVGPNGHDITEDKSKRIHTESAGARLVIMNAVAQQDDGQYKCLLGSQAMSAGRWEEADFQLKTYKRPSFEGTELRVIMQEGLAGHLICRVEFDQAASSPTVTWSRQGTPIDEMHDTAYRVIDYDSGSMESKLIIKPVKRAHAGSYTCHAIAETLHLSRPFEQTIELDVQFEPTFNSTRDIVWVERRLHPNGNANNSNTRHQNHNQNQYQHNSNGDLQQQQSVVMSNMHQNIAANKRRLMTTTQSSQMNGLNNLNGRQNGSTNSVLVELNCVCDSNPAASIVWSSGSSRLAIIKGTPPHIMEEPTLIKDATQTKSTLIIEYQLDPNWEFKQDEYICSASNMIGQATKRFSIQQGDTSPAFEIAPRVDYNQVTSLINFVILGPKTTNNNEINNNNNAKQQQPDVDAFRIRVDTHQQYNSHNNHNQGYQNNNLNINNNNYDALHPNQNHQHSSQSSSPFKTANSVILTPRTDPDSKEIIFPQNVTVSLASLPAGLHKLYLEAHNPVGWSRHRTELGEYKLVSNGANSQFSSMANQPYVILLISFCLTSVFRFLTTKSISSLSQSSR